MRVRGPIACLTLVLALAGCGSGGSGSSPPSPTASARTQPATTTSAATGPATTTSAATTPSTAPTPAAPPSSSAAVCTRLKARLSAIAERGGIAAEDTSRTTPAALRGVRRAARQAIAADRVALSELQSVHASSRAIRTIERGIVAYTNLEEAARRARPRNHAALLRLQSRFLAIQVAELRPVCVA